MGVHGHGSARAGPVRVAQQIVTRDYACGGRSPDSAARRDLGRVLLRRVLVGSEPRLITHTTRGITMLEKFMTIMLISDVKDEEKGATAVEYGLMVALIAVVIIAAVTPPRHQPHRPVHRGRRLGSDRADHHREGPALAYRRRRPLRSSQPARERPIHAAVTSLARRDERGATAVEYGLMVALSRSRSSPASALFGARSATSSSSLPGVHGPRSGAP